MRCEVAYALPGRQLLLSIELRPGATVHDAIVLSNIADLMPDLHVNDADVGVWSKPCSLDTPLKDGDRVEIYRPLIMDPKDARRKRAKL